MSSKDTPKGMATEGMPKGPEIDEPSQIEKGQPGVQAEMKTQPVSTSLPTQQGGKEDILSLEEYKGVGKFRGKVAIITGGDSGIGRAVALMLGKEGAKCICITHLPNERKDAETVAQELKRGGTQPMLIEQDLSEGEHACKKVVDQVVSEHGGVDVLILNHAIQYHSPDITNTTPEIVEDTFKTNIFPFFYFAKHAVPHMARGSAIVCSTSVTAYKGSPGLLEYSSTKGAIVSFIRSLSQQLASKGIRVNGVAGGPVRFSYFVITL